MPRYDAEAFAPPAPLAHVSLTNVRRRLACTDVPMLIDSGADVTLVPRGAVSRIKATVVPGREYELLGFDGTSSRAPAVRLELTWLGRAFVGQFLLIDDTVGILGRNILNAMVLVLDGPHLRWRAR